MPRQPRVYIEDVLYYVTSRSGHTENLFSEETDYREYISLVSKYKDQYGFKLFSYVLMPAHLHMLIELRNNVGISNIMHDINSLYTKLYNSKYAKKGHLFQARFRTVIAEKEEYLLPLTRHIHLNPKREKLTDEPTSYKYSSHIQYTDPSKRRMPNLEMEAEELFRCLGGREKEFDEYVRSSDKADADSIEKLLHRKRILGSSEFMERVSDIIEESVKLQKEDETPKRLQRIYAIIGGAAIVILAVMVSYFYRQASELKTEFNSTLELYKRTLDNLEKEKDTAVKQNKAIEDYEWKIKLTEKAIMDIKTQAERAAIERKALDGYSWNLDFSPIGETKGQYNISDAIYFLNGKIVSENLSEQGFPMSNYSRREDQSGVVVWETMQVDGFGAIANWHGEWDGTTMKGVLSVRSAAGQTNNFSFVSRGERLRKPSWMNAQVGGVK